MYSLIMFAVVLMILGLASHLGWSTDSRDSADWKSTNNGTRDAR